MIKTLRASYLNSVAQIYDYVIFRRTQFWTEKQLERYQLNCLKQVVNNAYKNTSYYKNIFLKNNIKPSDIQTLKDICKIPFLTREDVKNNLDMMVSEKFNKKRLVPFTTSGTSALPLKLYHSGYNRMVNLASYIYKCNFVGFKFLSPKIVIGGVSIPSNLVQKGQYWVRKENRLSMSSSFLNNETASSYIKEINNYKPVFMHVYPSAIFLLSKYMKKNNIKLTFKLKAILSESEILYDEQKALIKEVFQCPVYNSYSQRENVVIAVPCNKSDFLHVLPQRSICELIKPNGEYVTKEGEEGEIVGTSFDCPAMPLVRYKTGDIAVFTKEKCNCGRNYMLLKSIKGRIYDYIIDKLNRPILTTPIIFGGQNPDASMIKKMQFYQELPGKIIIKVEKEAKCRKHDNEIVNEIISVYRSKFNNRCDIEVVICSDIPLTASGKNQYFVQKLNVSQYV